MELRRVKLEVIVDLDSVAGPFSTPEDVQLRIQATLNNLIPHYYPVVRIKKD